MTVTTALLIDDDEQDRDTVRWHLEDAGLRVETIVGTFASPEELTAVAIAKGLDMTICDHRLQPHRLAQFFGAEVVAQLNKAKHPAILVTSYRESDAEASIRQYRRFVPAVVARSEIEEGDAFQQIANRVQAELDGDVPLQRQLHKTMVRVGNVAHTVDGRALDVFIDGWRPDEAIRIPPAMLPPELQSIEDEDLLFSVLAAEVNTAALSHDEVFFANVSLPIALAEWRSTGSGSGHTFPTLPGFELIRPSDGD